MWMVRCDGGQLAETFLEKGRIAIGWPEVGSFRDIVSREQAIDRVKNVWPDFKLMKTVVIGSQLFKVAKAIKIGDRVMTYDPSQRLYHIGRISGDYEFVEKPEYRSDAHRRNVIWESQVDRDNLSLPAKNSLGSTLSVFEVSKRIQNEIDSLISGKPMGSAPIETDVAEEVVSDTKELFDSYKARAREFIKDKMSALSHDQLPELIAGVLRAMGYKTKVSPPGTDRGKDIVASPDGLGLEQPRIVVEVKHRSVQIGAPDIRSFIGGRHKDDRGLHVSTGGFSKEAKYEAERASIPLTLIDGDHLVDLIIENYEKMDVEARTLLPLKRFYWPS